MPSTYCAVATCKNNRFNAKKMGLKISFHRFPKDKELRDAWILGCKRDRTFNPGTGFVCSEHFTSDDYQVNYKRELLGIPCKPVLKKYVVPSIKLDTEDDEVITIKHEIFDRADVDIIIEEIHSECSALERAIFGADGTESDMHFLENVPRRNSGQSSQINNQKINIKCIVERTDAGIEKNTAAG